MDSDRSPVASLPREIDDDIIDLAIRYGDGELSDVQFTAAIRATCLASTAHATEFAAEIEGIRRFLSGEQVGASMDIAEQPSYGYGDLDGNGFWQYPVPAELVALRRDLQRLRDQQGTVIEALKWRIEGEHDDATHWPKGSERDGHRGEWATCPNEDCRLIHEALALVESPGAET